MADTMSLRGELRGHRGWVTAIATTEQSDQAPKLLSASRDKTIIVWNLEETDHGDMGDGRVPLAGTPLRALRGHSHFVEDVVISSDGQYALSASWDATLRLWNIDSGVSTHRFVGHTKDVLSCAFSAENRQIVSGSRDKTVKLWNTVGECKFDIVDNGHTEWVSCVRFSPENRANPLIVSCGWDNLVKVWQLKDCKLIRNLVGHEGYLNTVTISPDGSLCASGGKDGIAMLWDLNEGKRLYSLVAEAVIHALVFSPNRYWLCAATSSDIRVWDLETKELVGTLQVPVEAESTSVPHCLSLCWSADGSNLYGGYTDNVIRVWKVNI